MTTANSSGSHDVQSGISSQLDGYVATITIDRPHRMNSLDSAANRAIAQVFQDLDSDPDVRAIVVTGAGNRAFCTGADLKADPEHTGPRVSFAGITGVGGPMIEVGTPMIAAVSGYAIGGGFELAAACDIIVASHSASFSIPEGVKGFLAESPVGHRAMRQLPHHVALDLALTGRAMDGAEAERWGFVNYLVDQDQVVAKASEVAHAVAAGPPLALRAFKSALKSRSGWPLDVAMSTRFELIEQYQHTDEQREGLAAFRERRQARWTGR